MYEESGQADCFSNNIAGEILEEILDTVLELPGQVVIALHLIALHLFILYQHVVNPDLVVTRLVILYR
jgi:hypothetical protein